MRKFQLLPLLLVFLSLSSCELIGDIFQAGMAVGILAVVLVVALLIWLLSKVF